MAVYVLTTRKQSSKSKSSFVPRVAIVLCSTSKGLSNSKTREMALTSVFLPSLVATVERDKFQYGVYVGIDADDPLFTRPRYIARVRSMFHNLMIHFHAFPASPNRPPFNQILRVAFSSGADYIVRVNDDTEFSTRKWTTLAVEALSSFDPPNVGVVGPRVTGPENINHNILTHDMVHMTHMLIFDGVYYPEVFENQWLDDWITHVYSPSRKKTIEEWTVHHHTAHHGTRYNVNTSIYFALDSEINKGKMRLYQWLLQKSRKETPPDASCSAEQHNFPINKNLVPVTDAIGMSGVSVVALEEHGDFEHLKHFGLVNERLRSTYCSMLHPSVWIECMARENFTNVAFVSKNKKKQLMCTRMSYIAKVECAFVELWGSVNKFVPGAVFDGRYVYTPQPYSRPVRTDYIPRHILKFDELAVALYPYPDAKGHFVHETLSRIVWLLKTLPKHIPILAPRMDWTERYYDVLNENGWNTSRIIPFNTTNEAVLFAKNVYVAHEWPHCLQQDNPNIGGEPSEYPYEIMAPLRRAMVPRDARSKDRKTIIFIDRPSGPRSLSNGQTVFLSLTKSFSRRWQVQRFGQSEWDLPLRKHIKMFKHAAVVIGPHGAGLANMVFCAENTAVIEIGFNGNDVMYMDEMYYQLAMGLHLRYWLVMGNGTYRGSISVDSAAVIDAVSAALAGVDPN